ncbi:MAG: ATP-binding protein [Ktedonobacterales bacterium]
MTERISGHSGRFSIMTMTDPSLGDHDGDAHIVGISPGARWQDELFLSRASILLTESLDDTAIREHAVRLPLPYLADWCALHLVTVAADGGKAPFIVCAHVDADQEPRARALWQRNVQVTPRTIPSLSRVLRDDERPSPPALVDVALDPIPASHDSPAARILARVGLATAVHVPLVVGKHSLGVLTFASVTPGRYGPREVALAIAYTNRVAGVLYRAQRYRQAVEILHARDIALIEIAHDLKAPVAQMTECAEDMHRQLTLRQNSQCDEQARRDCIQIESTARVCIDMLDDMVAESMPEEDADETLWLEKTDLVTLVRETVGSYSNLAKRYSLSFEADNAGSIVGYWNPGALRRILDNVLSNAINFSRPGGTITLRVWRGEARVHPGAPRREWAYLQVQDQGMGIPPCDLPYIFEPFYRGGNVKKVVRGTGIGLTSVRSLVQRHEGTVRMASAPGEGACLTIMLPLDRASQRSLLSRRMGRRDRVGMRATNLSHVPD